MAERWNDFVSRNRRSPDLVTYGTFARAVLKGAQVPKALGVIRNDVWKGGETGQSTTDTSATYGLYHTWTTEETKEVHRRMAPTFQADDAPYVDLDYTEKVTDKNEFELAWYVRLENTGQWVLSIAEYRFNTSKNHLCDQMLAGSYDVTRVLTTRPIRPEKLTPLVAESLNVLVRQWSSIYETVSEYKPRLGY